jgi:hypothetical protein
MSNFIKIRSVGVELAHADGKTERHDEGTRRFSQFFESTLKSCNTIASRCLCVLPFQILTNCPVFNTTIANIMPLMATTTPCFFQFPNTGYSKQNVVTTETRAITEVMLANTD